MTAPFVRAYPPTESALGNAYWVPLRNRAVLVQQTEQGPMLIQGGEEIRALLHPDTVLYLGLLEGKTCLACEVSQDFPLPTGWRALTQRELLGQLDDRTSFLIGYASELLLWQHTSHYCPVCAHATESIAGSWGRMCPNCGYSSYPPVTPAILVLIHDDDRILLAHKPGWGKRYSCVAGFVEPGETLEECVQREIYEEVGVEVTEVTYVKSQPWPFPHQLMVGFTARYAGGEIHPDQQEIDDAAWFRVDALPEMPPPLSLARQLITTWIEAQHAQNS